jgi:phosphopantetheinyl transferase
LQRRGGTGRQVKRGASPQGVGERAPAGMGLSTSAGEESSGTWAEPSACAEPMRTSTPSMPPHRQRLPMVGEILRLEPGHEVVVRRQLDLDEDLYGGHHTVGGREVSHVHPERNGHPVVPMTFTLEMMAEASALLFPDFVVTVIRDVQLFKWLSFDEDRPSSIELTARVQSTADEVATLEVRVRDLGAEPDRENNAGAVAAAGTVEMAARYPEPPAAKDFSLSNERPCRIPLDVLYKNLFHGEKFQGVCSLDRFGDEGIQGQIRVLPREGLFRSTADPAFLLDPVLMDVAMHPLAGWHLEQPDQSGRILLPYELKEIRFYGPRPAVGTEMTSQGRIVHESARRFTHTVDVVGPHGRLWCRMSELKYWRFYLPFGEFNFHGPKDDYFLSESWPEVVGELAEATHPAAWCVRLVPPRDLQQPGLMLATARVTLSPAELRQFRALEAPDKRKSEWLFGRLAAKDAVRHLWKRLHRQRFVPADLEVEPDQHGRPVVRPIGFPRPAGFPQVSVSHTEGVIVGAASCEGPIGIDIERVVPREESFEKIAFDEDERRLLDRFTDRAEAIARFWCAKEAVAKALGRGLVEGPRTLAVIEAADDGRLAVRLGAALAEMFPERRDVPLLAQTHCTDGVVVAVCRLTAGGGA